MNDLVIWALTRELPGRLKWPLVVLAWRADDRRLVQLAIEDLAFLAGLSERGWTNVASELEALQYIEEAARPPQAPKVWRVCPT